MRTAFSRSGLSRVNPLEIAHPAGVIIEVFAGLPMDSETTNISPGTDARSHRAAAAGPFFLAYCAVLGMTFAFVSYQFVFHPVGSEFLGLYLGAVTLPWSIVVMPVLALGTPDLPWFNVVALLACGVLNAFLIRRPGRRRTNETSAR